MQKWEYQSLNLSLRKGGVFQWEDNNLSRSDQGMSQKQRLDKMGRDGWELVQIVPSVSQGYTVAYAFFFKRSVA